MTGDLFGGIEPRQSAQDKMAEYAVWGGPSRLCDHGVLTLKDEEHPAVGRMRRNLTFRGTR